MALKLRLEEQLFKQGLTYADVSRLLGVHRNVVSRWNTEEVMPNMASLEGLCRGLGIGLDEVVAFDPPLVKYAEPDEPIELVISPDDLDILQRALTALIVASNENKLLSSHVHALADLVNRLQNAKEAAVVDYKAKIEARQEIERAKTTQDGKLDERKVYEPDRFDSRRGEHHWKRKEKLKKEEGTV